MLQTLAKLLPNNMSTHFFLHSLQPDRQRPTDFPHNAGKFSQLGQAAAGKVFEREEGDVRTHQERTAKTDKTAHIASSASHKTSTASNPEQSEGYASNPP